MPSANSRIILPPPILGQQSDRPQLQVDPNAAYRMSNFLFRYGKLQVRPGVRNALLDNNDDPAPAPAALTGMIQYSHEDEPFRIVGGGYDSWYWWDSGSQVWASLDDTTPGNENPLTGGRGDLVQFRPFTVGGVTWLLGVNGKDAPKAWDGEAASYYRDIIGCTSAAKCIAVAGDSVFLAGFAGAPQLVEFSDLRDFDAGWGTFPKVLSETPGPITAMGELGAMSLAVYKTDAIYLVESYTPEYPFTYYPRFLGVPGPVGPAALVKMQSGDMGGHAFLAEDGAVYGFDGTTLRSLGGNIQSHILSRWNYELRSRAWGYFDPDYKELVFFFPSRYTGACDEGIVIGLPEGRLYPIWLMQGANSQFDFTGGQVGRLTDALTIGEMTGPIGGSSALLSETSFDSIARIYCDTTGHIWTVYNGPDQVPGHPTEIQSTRGSFEYGLNYLGAPERWKTVHTVDHFWTYPTGDSTRILNIQMIGSINGEDVYDAEAPQAIDLTNYVAVIDYGGQQFKSASPLRTDHRFHTRLLGVRYYGEFSYPVEFRGISVALSMRSDR